MCSSRKQQSIISWLPSVTTCRAVGFLQLPLERREESVFPLLHFRAKCASQTFAKCWGDHLHIHEICFLASHGPAALVLYSLNNLLSGTQNDFLLSRAYWNKVRYYDSSYTVINVVIYKQNQSFFNYFVINTFIRMIFSYY